MHNQVLTHAVRAAVLQLFMFQPCQLPLCGRLNVKGSSQWLERAQCRDQRAKMLLSLHNPVACAACALGQLAGRATHRDERGDRPNFEPHLTGDARLEFLRNSGPAPEMKMERTG